MKDGIAYITKGSIDRKKYDACVLQAENSRIYGSSAYLDRCCPQWAALVLGDYEAVLPLAGGKKWGLSYTYTPFWIQALAVYSKSKASPGLEKRFFEHLSKAFFHSDLCLYADLAKAKSVNRSNVFLDLSKSYEDLKKGYNENRRRQLKKSAEHLSLDNALSDQTLMDFYRETKASNYYPESALQTLERLLKCDAFEKVKLAVWKNKDMAQSSDKELVMVFFGFRFQGRLMHLASGASDEGLALGAPTFLMDGLIRKHAAQPLILDFMGSSNPGLFKFYMSFGGQSETYQHIKEWCYGRF